MRTMSTIEPTLIVYTDHTDSHREIENCIKNMNNQLRKYDRYGNMNLATIYENAIKVAQLIAGRNRLDKAEPVKRKRSHNKPTVEEPKQIPLLSPANLDARIEATRVTPLFSQATTE